MSTWMDVLGRASSANVSDALRSCGMHFQAMDGGIRPLDAKFRIVAPAFTVRCYPGATWALENALELAQPGDVLVVDGAAADDVILMGGLMSLRAQKRGIAGVIMDGAVRDVDDILRLEFPVFTRHVCPRAGTFAEIGEWQTTICCGRVPVSPGDVIIADISGVVVVPSAKVEQAAAATEKLLFKESHLDESLRAGRSLSEAGAAYKRAIGE